MPWFYYSGNVPKSMPVKKGLSVSVPPHSKVEILEPGLREVQALKKKGLLRRTGRPAGAKSIADVLPTTAADIRAVTPKSAMALKIAEKGVTTDKGQAPKKPKGSPEMTEGELTALDKERKASKPSEDAPVESPTSIPLPGDGGFINADRVEVLSDADESPDENTGGAVDSKKKKKKRRN